MASYTGNGPYGSTSDEVDWKAPARTDDEMGRRVCCVAATCKRGVRLFLHRSTVPPREVRSMALVSCTPPEERLGLCGVHRGEDERKRVQSRRIERALGLRKRVEGDRDDGRSLTIAPFAGRDRAGPRDAGSGTRKSDRFGAKVPIRSWNMRAGKRLPRENESGETFLVKRSRLTHATWKARSKALVAPNFLTPCFSMSAVSPRDSDTLSWLLLPPSLLPG